MNPYAQAGWTGNYNTNALNGHNRSASSSAPTLFGALPYSTPPSTAPTFITFTFSPVDGTILNSIVTGPHGRTYFTANTDNASPRLTALRNAQLETVSRIEWRNFPILEVGGILPRCSATQWLALSGSRTYRTMTARGRTFRWTPQGAYIELSNTGSAPTPTLFGRVSQGSNSSVILELTPEAVHIGLLEVSVVATLLMMSGINID